MGVLCVCVSAPPQGLPGLAWLRRGDGVSVHLLSDDDDGHDGDDACLPPSRE